MKITWELNGILKVIFIRMEIKEIEGYKNNRIVVKENGKVVHECYYNDNEKSVLPNKQLAKQSVKEWINKN